MDIINAIERMKEGGEITKEQWKNTSLKLTKLEDGSYKLFIQGDLNPEALNLISNNYEVKG